MTVIRKSKLPLGRMTLLDREAEIKRRKGQEEERIEVLGQESDRKAIPWVQKDVSEQEFKEKEYLNLIAELLQKALKDKKNYIRILSQIFLHFLKDETIPKKFFIDIEANDIGLKVEIKNTLYYGAFKACGIPAYDIRACKVLSMKLGNTVAKLSGYTRKSEGGISLPDGEDLRVYG